MAATVFVDIFEIDGIPVNNISGSVAMVFSQDGQYESTDEGYGTHIWNGSLTIDLDAMIDARLPLSKINDAMATLEAGTVTRSVITF